MGGNTSGHTISALYSTEQQAEALTRLIRDNNDEFIGRHRVGLVNALHRRQEEGQLRSVLAAGEVQCHTLVVVEGTVKVQDMSSGSVSF